MNRVPANENNKIKSKCSKATDKQYTKCQQLDAQRIMGSNTSRRRIGTSSLDPAATTATATDAAATAPAVRVRDKCPHARRGAQNARSVLKATIPSKITAALSGSAGTTAGGASTETSSSALTPAGSLNSVASVCSDVTVCCNISDKIEERDDVNTSTIICGAPIYSDAAEDAACIAESGFPTSTPLPSSIHATKESGSVVASKTAETMRSLKIATTKTHMAALTVARQPRTHTTAKTTRRTRAAIAARQLMKARKITASTTTTTVNERVTMAAVPAHAVEAYSDATRRAQSSVRLTSATTTPILRASQVAGVLTAVDVKSKFTENKCPLVVLTNVSNQRKVEVNSTIPPLEQCILNSYNVNLRQHNNSSNNRSRKSEVPSNKWSPVFDSDNADNETRRTVDDSDNSISEDIRRTLNLAARKAKLKSEFFRDFELHDKTNNQLTQSSTPLDVCDVDLPKQLLDNSSPNFWRPQVSEDGARYMRHQPIPCSVTALPTISVNAAETSSPPSLIARRKLDLKRKFEHQSSPKTSPNCDQPYLVGIASAFPRVEDLVQKFDSQPTRHTRKMIVNPNKPSEAVDSNMLSLKSVVLEQRSSPLSDEGCNLGQSPYSSDNEDNELTHITSMTAEQLKRKDKVARSASSDSALGLDVDESMDTTSEQPPAGSQQRRMTLTVTDLPLRPALLPLAEPTALPDSPTIDPHQTANNLPTQVSVPTKVLLEERVVELPEDPRSLAPSLPCSRRESAQSCGSDYTPTEFPGGRRFVRTPSVVVSDYSDDVMCGITLEEIEYFRAQRMRRRHSSLDTANEGEGESDVSASSSCSNLYYCGSTISALDGAECYVNGVRTALERKTSDCSACSVSADEESFTIPEDPQQQAGKDLADLLAAQHLTTKPTIKKVFSNWPSKFARININILSKHFVFIGE
ncbi:serine-rich adhesin for platelets-like isoform X2 [Anastrepha ludens]|uniref:serine-rich adhesin for platelets-like isoform X2 n=1 Tax=Anastrepha ludens TaxID=28586 RepID=UPI0023AF32D7|nr:serine-rich adhesin for platelets-like isoform X2 [Anastrepha ludens]